MSIKVNRPFAMQGPKNARELGGYLTSDGRRTKEHVFLRADGLDSLTGADRKFLRQYPVRLVIDLRSVYETRLAPDRLDRHFEQVHVPMFDHVQSELARRASGGFAEQPPRAVSLAEIYMLLADTEQEQIRTVLKQLIDTDEPALFHCTAGKDRTGIISMFLLEMAGVPEATIIADYEATAQYLSEAYSFAQDAEDIPADAFASRAETLQQLRSHLRGRYGGIREYLRRIGITDEDEEKLRRKFTEPAAAN